jgi:hypothetical protein
LSRAALARGIGEGQAVAVNLIPDVMAERVDKHAGAWRHDVPANLLGSVHARPALGRLRLLERKHARVVDHDRHLGQHFKTRVAKVDKRVELTGAEIGVEAQ